MDRTRTSGGEAGGGDAGPARAEALLRAVLEAIEDGVLVIADSGQVVLHNARLADLWAFPEALLRQGSGPALLAHVAGQVAEPRALPPCLALSEAESQVTQDTLRLRDGRVVECRTAPLLSAAGERERAWLFRDVTAGSRAVEALRASRELLSESQRAARIGSWELDLPTGALVWTDECYRIYGYAPGELQPSLGLLLEHLAVPDDRAHMEEHYRRTLATGVFAQPFEYRIRLRTGEVRWVSVTGAVLRDAGGAPVRLVGTQQDVTDRKRVEEERLELERRLLHAQKLESLGLLAGGIAHDFNNLLAAIQSNLDLALACHPGGEATLHLEEAALAVRKAAGLTHQMLAYSGRAHSRRSAIDLDTLVEENARLLRSSIPKLVSVEPSLAGALPQVVGDPAQLQQLLMNLVINAAEAIGDRSGTISIRTGVATFDREALRAGRLEEPPAPGPFVVLDVRDTGCGMDAATLQRLFDPFFTTKSMGRGLGMSAILGIIRGHRGTIFVDSAPGKGTRIRVLLPAAAPPGAREEPAPAAPAAASPSTSAAGLEPRGRGSILVVDDEDGVRRACARLLRRLGWPVLTASDGAEAVALFRARSAEVACVILDLSMPRLDGVATFRELRAIRADVQVILSSGYTRDQVSVQAILDEGLAGFIQKPYDLEALEREVRRVTSGAGEAAPAPDAPPAP